MSRGARYILVLLLVLLAVTAIILIGGGDGKDGSGKAGVTPRPQQVSEYHLTATYGAQMFREQLTAIASEQATPAAPSP